jgi:hypothetical protein
MSWQLELPLLIRSFINDLDETPQYSDDRIMQLALVAAQHTIIDIEFNTKYTIDVVNQTINPDPTVSENKDINFIGLVALKSACLLDQSSLRTRAQLEGISTSLGPAKLDISSGLSGYKTIIEYGPCKMYDQLKTQYVLGDASRVRAILSPFVGNNFDPQTLNNNGSDYRRIDTIIT